MPRAKNPRAARRRAKSARAQIQIERAHAVIRAGRRDRAVETALRTVRDYDYLRKMDIRLAVQARIDAMQLAAVNAERVQAGLDPLDCLPPDV